MVEINWTLITYIIIGFFILAGFSRGWWKEAITTFFLGFFIFLLNTPQLAQWFIDMLNSGFSFIWQFLPSPLKSNLATFLEAALGLTSTERTIIIDASNGATWLVILLLFIGLSILITRFTLPNKPGLGKSYSSYVVTPIGGMLGGIIGGLNGFLIINLIREYLDGRSLPLNDNVAPELTKTGVSVQAVELPASIVFDSSLPWLIIGLGVVLLVLLINTRGFWGSKTPLGYVKRLPT